MILTQKKDIEYRIEVPDMHLCGYTNLIFDKGSKNMMEKKPFQQILLAKWLSS
jgi:hypothetical protein